MPPVRLLSDVSMRSDLPPGAAQSRYSAPLINLVFGLRVPFGDEPVGQRHLHVRIQLARTVEVHHRRLHAHGSRESPLEAAISEVVDESGEIVLATQGVP